MLLQDVIVRFQRPLPSNDALKIEYSSSVVCDLMMQSIGRSVRTNGFWRICISIEQEKNVSPPKIAGGVLYTYTAFDVDRYAKQNPEDKKRTMTKFVSGSLKKAFDFGRLSAAAIDRAEKFVVEKNYERLVLPKKQVRPSVVEGRSAHVECAQGFDDASVYLVLKRGRTTLRKVLLERTKPDEFIFGNWLGPVTWQDEGCCILQRLDGRVVRVDLNAPVPLKPRRPSRTAAPKPAAPRRAKRAASPKRPHRGS